MKHTYWFHYIRFANNIWLYFETVMPKAEYQFDKISNVYNTFYCNTIMVREGCLEKGGGCWWLFGWTGLGLRLGMNKIQLTYKLM